MQVNQHPFSRSSKLVMRVRFPSPAPTGNPRSGPLSARPDSKIRKPYRACVPLRATGVPLGVISHRTARQALQASAAHIRTPVQPLSAVVGGFADLRRPDLQRLPRGIRRPGARASDRDRVPGDRRHGRRRPARRAHPGDTVAASRTPMESIAELILSSNQVRLRCAPPRRRFPRRALALGAPLARARRAFKERAA